MRQRLVKLWIQCKRTLIGQQCCTRLGSAKHQGLLWITSARLATATLQSTRPAGRSVVTDMCAVLNSVTMETWRAATDATLFAITRSTTFVLGHSTLPQCVVLTSLFKVNFYQYWKIHQRIEWALRSSCPIPLPRPLIWILATSYSRISLSPIRSSIFQATVSWLLLTTTPTTSKEPISL